MADALAVWLEAVSKAAILLVFLSSLGVFRFHRILKFAGIAPAETVQYRFAVAAFSIFLLVALAVLLRWSYSAPFFWEHACQSWGS